MPQQEQQEDERQQRGGGGGGGRGGSSAGRRPDWSSRPAGLPPTPSSSASPSSRPVAPASFDHVYVDMASLLHTALRQGKKWGEVETTRERERDGLIAAGDDEIKKTQPQPRQKKTKLFSKIRGPFRAPHLLPPRRPAARNQAAEVRGARPRRAGPSRQAPHAEAAEEESREKGDKGGSGSGGDDKDR